MPSKIKTLFLLFAVLFALWLLLSGHYDILFFAYGIGTCLLCVWLAWRMGIADSEQAIGNSRLTSPLYMMWMLKEMVLSSLTVLKIVLFNRAITPEITTVNAPDNNLKYTIYANSITLTPGTISVATGEDSITVHALTPEGARDVESGAMQNMVEKLA